MHHRFTSLFLLAHLALTARLAISVRCSEVSARLRAALPSFAISFTVMGRFLLFMIS